MNRRTALKTWGALAAAAVYKPALSAETFPSRPIKIVVPYPPGGVTDIAARMAGEVLTERYGQPVIVENRPGANGVIGDRYVAAQPADGYTLLLNGLGGITLPAVTMHGLPLDLVKSFVPVAQVAEFVNVLIVSSNSPVKSVADLVALAKAKGGAGLSYGSNGIGTSAHMTTEFFAQRTGIKAQHVPYKGSPEVVVDVINGNLDFCFSNLPPVLGLIKKGSVRAIAVTSAYRSNQLPDLHTMAEEGLPDFNVTSWLGVYGPAGMDPALVKTLGDVIVQGLNQPARIKTLGGAGFEPKPGAAAQFLSVNQSEYARWGRIARDAQISLAFGS